MLQRGGGGRTCEGCPTSEVQHHARRAALDHGKAGTTNTQKGDRAMTIKEVQAKARELKELKRMREELDGEIGELETALKDSMGECELLIAGEYRLTYQGVSSSRFDTAAFRKAFPDIARQFTKNTVYRRFCVQ